MPTAATVLSDYAALPVMEQNIVIESLLKPTVMSGLGLHDYIEQERFAGGRACPFCGCSHIVKNGHRKDSVQRYVCHGCGKSFVMTANSIAAHSHKHAGTWEQFIECMLEGQPVRYAAFKCRISKTTAFIWRHKILDALHEMADGVKLDGLVEADETFFAISYKGNHSKSRRFTMPRKPHKNGKSTSKRGLSKDKVCVPCAVNRTGLSIAKVSCLAKVSTKALNGVFGGRILPGSHVIADKASAYLKFASGNGLGLTRLKGGKPSSGSIYNLSHINSYHNELKRFIKHVMKGVSTKYLNNYLIWHNFVHYSNGEYADKKKNMLSYVLKTPFSEKGREIPSRKPVPVIA